jgi:hypothetical protein
MRRLCLVPLLMISACSKPAHDAGATDARTSDMDKQESPATAVSAAPGVAFNYHYAFRIPNARIAAVQEDHAAACEKLGLDRCRITGMRYRLINNDEIDAMLAFKLDPAIAREFGKQGIAAVGRAEGMLIDSEITGVDAGAVITETNRATAALRGQLTAVETRMKQPALSVGERRDLFEQAASLREQLRSAASVGSSARASLATTPMVFDYGSGNVIPGFNGQSPLRDAFATAVASFMAMVSFLLIAFGLLLPWALVAAAGYALFRLIKRRWPHLRNEA